MRPFTLVIYSLTRWLAFIIFFCGSVLSSCSSDLIFESNQCLDFIPSPQAVQISSSLQIAGRWRLAIWQIQDHCDHQQSPDIYLREIHSSVVNIDTKDGDIVYYADHSEEPEVIGVWFKDQPLRMTFSQEGSTQELLPYFDSLTLHVTDNLVNEPDRLSGVSSFEVAGTLVSQGQFELIKLYD